MNKKTKKKITTIALLVCVFALAAAGTLAYFADQTDVATNTFTMGKVQIRLSEGIVDAAGKSADTPFVYTAATETAAAKREYTAYNKVETANENALIWDVDGKELTNDDTRTKDGNKDAFVISDNEKYGYSLVPGKIVDKDPVVTVLKNSEDSYVRVKVTLDHCNEFKTVYAGHFGGSDPLADAIAAVSSSFVGLDSSENAVWVLDADSTKIDTEKNTITVVFNYKDIVAKNVNGNTNLEPIVNGFMLPTWVDNDDVKEFMVKTEVPATNDTPASVTYSGTPTFKVEVIAEAIQAEGFADAKAAWTAFDAQMNPETTTTTNP